MNFSHFRDYSLIFLIFLGHIVTVSRANLVRRSADPEPEYEFPRDDENAGDDVDDYMEKEFVIESQGQNFTVTLGETVRLPCKASSPAVVLLWTKDSIRYSLGLTKLDAPKSVTLENNDLVVHDVKMTDMGTYVCQIAGMPNKSVVHTLNLEKLPEIVSIHVTDEGILVEGMDVTITCNATGFPKPTLIWTKIISDEEIMKLGIDRAEFGPNSVTIRNVTRSDAGAYACYAINNVNEGRAANITLHVLGKPLVHVHRTVNNSAPNLEVILECTVQGEPLSNIYWLKDGKRILDQYVIEMDEQSSTLKVRPYSAKTVGVFTCVAENSYGRQEETINLLKYPLIDTVTDTLNEKTFRWTVTSYLPLEQTVVTIKERDQAVWRNVSLLVPEANDHTYNVRYVLDRENYKPGNYSAILRVKMDGEWSDSQDLQHIELEPLRDYAVSPMIMNSIRTLCLIFVPGFHAFI